MTKKETAWLIVRTSGVAFGFAALWHVCAAAYYAYLMLSPPRDSGHGYFFAREAAFWEILAAFAYSLLCFYFLRRGVWVYRMLVREAP